MRECNFLYRLLIVVLLCLVSYTAVADDTWIDPNGKPIPEQSNMKSKEGFGAQLWFVTDKTFFDEWKKSSISVRIPAVNWTTRLKELFPIVLLSWSDTHSSAPCDVIYRIVVRKPDGGIYADIPNVVACSGEKIPARKLFLAEDYYGLTVEPQEPLGDYSVTVSITDRTSGISLDLSGKFSVIQQN